MDGAQVHNTPVNTLSLFVLSILRVWRTTEPATGPSPDPQVIADQDHSAARMGSERIRIRQALRSPYFGILRSDEGEDAGGWGTGKGYGEGARHRVPAGFGAWAGRVQHLRDQWLAAQAG